MSTQQDKNNRQNREQLKTYFETGDRPTEIEFAEAIDSWVNQLDDDFHAVDNKIGIGTDDPKRKLHVVGKTFISEVKGQVPCTHNTLEVNGENAHPLALITNANDIINLLDKGTVINPKPFTITDQAGRGFRFYQNLPGGSGNGEQFSIYPNGNVGVNMVDGQAPTAKFQVRGTSEGEGGKGILRVEGPAREGDANLRFGVVNGERTWIQSHGSKPLYINKDGNDIILNPNNDNVGIGTTDPKEKLHVDGNIRVENNIIGKQTGGSLDIYSNKDGQGGYMRIFSSSYLNGNGTPHRNQGGTTFVSRGNGQLNGFNFLTNNVDPSAGGNQKSWDLAMRIDGYGNVGVGTQTDKPENKLHIRNNDVSDSTGTGLRLETGAGENNVLVSNGVGDAHWKPLTDSSLVGNSLVPKGIIVMWSGTVPPDNWALCDGNDNNPINGVYIPDLRGKFVAGFDPRDTDYNDTKKIGPNYAGSDYELVEGGKKVKLKEGAIPRHSHIIDKSKVATTLDGSHSHKLENLRHRDGTPAHHNADYLGLVLGDHKNAFSYNKSTNGVGNHSHKVEGVTDTMGHDNAHENRPPYFVLAYIIKT